MTLHALDRFGLAMNRARLQIIRVVTVGAEGDGIWSPQHVSAAAQMRIVALETQTRFHRHMEEELPFRCQLGALVRMTAHAELVLRHDHLETERGWTASSSGAGSGLAGRYCRVRKVAALTLICCEGSMGPKFRYPHQRAPVLFGLPGCLGQGIQPGLYRFGSGLGNTGKEDREDLVARRRGASEKCQRPECQDH